jgi:hypothetical protein
MNLWQVTRDTLVSAQISYCNKKSIKLTWTIAKYNLVQGQLYEFLVINQGVSTFSNRHYGRTQRRKNLYL